jgi:hypothetical protein
MQTGNLFLSFYLRIERLPEMFPEALPSYFPEFCLHAPCLETDGTCH